MVNNVAEYKWSSFGDYYLSYNGQNTMIDVDVIKNYFDTFKEFNKFMNIKNDDYCLENKIVKYYNDSDLKEIISKEYNIDNFNELSMYEKQKVIKEIYNNKVTSIRQLNRISGVGKTIVENAIKKDG